MDFDDLGLTTGEGNFIVKALIGACIVGFIVGFCGKKIFKTEPKDD